MDKRKVYITNYSIHDYSSAEKFGELVPLTSGTINIKNINRMIMTVAEKLIDSDKDDYLLLSGHQSTVAVSVAIMLLLHGRVKVLIWDFGKNEYVMRTITKNKIYKAIKIARDVKDAIKTIMEGDDDGNTETENQEG